MHWPSVCVVLVGLAFLVGHLMRPPRGPEPAPVGGNTILGAHGWVPEGATSVWTMGWQVQVDENMDLLVRYCDHTWRFSADRQSRYSAGGAEG
jgi:hypothetical protein